MDCVLRIEEECRLNADVTTVYCIQGVCATNNYHQKLWLGDSLQESCCLLTQRQKAGRGYQLLRGLQHGPLSAPTFPRCTLHHICSSVSMEVIHNAGLVTVFSLFILSPITLVSKFYLDSSAEGSAEDKRWENVLNSVVLEWSAVVLPRRDIGNVWRHFWFTQEDCYSHLVARVQGCHRHLTVQDSLLPPAPHPPGKQRIIWPKCQ